MTTQPAPEGLSELVADARANEFTSDRIETFWGRQYAFRPTDDGRLQVWEWYGHRSEGPERSFLTTFSLDGQSDAEIARRITSEYAWCA